MDFEAEDSSQVALSPLSEEGKEKSAEMDFEAGEGGETKCILGRVPGPCDPPQVAFSEECQKMATRKAVYTGFFDPIHLGHVDIIRRGSGLVDRLVVGVGQNPEKTPFFTMDERVELVKKVVAQFPNVDVKPFEGLAV